MPMIDKPEKTLSVAGGNTRRLLGPSRPGSSSGQNNSQQQNGVVRSSAPPQAANVAQEKLSVEQAKALKMQPPNTLQPRAQSMAMKRQTSQSTEEEKDNDRPSNTSIKREPGQNPFGVQAVQRRQYEQADDETDLTYGSAGWDPEAHDEQLQTTVFRGGDLNRHLALSRPHLQAEFREAQAARQGGQAAMPTFGTYYDDGRPGATYDHDASVLSADEDFDEEEGMQQLGRDTPSRTIMSQGVSSFPAKHGLGNHKQVSFNQLEQDGSSEIDSDDDRRKKELAKKAVPQQVISNNSLARHAAHREEIKHYPPPEPPRPQIANPMVVTKVPASNDGPEEEPQPFNPPHPMVNPAKRSRDELDYDIEDLRAKSFASLNEVPFLVNPRAPPSKPQVDNSGNPLHGLSVRLDNLKNMSPADQKTLFMTLTDDENEQTGDWFIQAFSDNLKQLMEKRLDRRKIALKFELEAKKRHTAVQAKMAQCESELTELKTGGHKLVEGRSVAKIGGTPRKAMSMPPV